jgi:hypothetical protein
MKLGPCFSIGTSAGHAIRAAARLPRGLRPAAADGGTGLAPGRDSAKRTQNREKLLFFYLQQLEHVLAKDRVVDIGENTSRHRFFNRLTADDARAPVALK